MIWQPEFTDKILSRKPGAVHNGQLRIGFGSAKHPDCRGITVDELQKIQARLEHGGIKPHLERFAIGELIQDVAQKFDLTIETRQLQLRLDIPHTLPLINADVSMIERVVTNLVDNAVRHTPQGGTIRLKVWQEHDLLQVEVADSGPGVEENMRAQLFQRPSALSQKASRETRGGLGLLIVRRMLELHGGGIHLMDATPGACFRFFVPL